MEAAGNSAALFMISWSFISQIILALLLALLIDTYSDEDDGEGEEEEEDQGPGEEDGELGTGNPYSHRSISFVSNKSDEVGRCRLTPGGTRLDPRLTPG